jgi:hypothetical protein
VLQFSDALEQQIAMTRFIETPQSYELWCQLRNEIGQNSAEFYDAARLTLKRADPYYWSPDLCPFLASAAPKMPWYSLREDMLPSPFGFVWFARPVSLPSGSHEPRNLTAFSWGHAPQANAMWFVTYLQHPIRSNGVLGSSGFWEYGHETPAFGPAGLDGLVQARLTLQVKVIAAAFLFLNQSVLTAVRHQAERHVRHRAERERWQNEPVVRVVELRRREQIGEKSTPVEPVEREWSCQWVVRGHWRQQFYPSRHGTQPIWITPYVKGPEDKPLKLPRATVFAVIR